MGKNTLFELVKNASSGRNTLMYAIETLQDPYDIERFLNGYVETRTVTGTEPTQRALTPVILLANAYGGAIERRWQSAVKVYLQRAPNSDPTRNFQ